MSDSNAGRYLTPDPIGLEGGIDPYVYTENQPVNMIDPEGLSSTDVLVREIPKYVPYTLPALLPAIAPILPYAVGAAILLTPTSIAEDEAPSNVIPFPKAKPKCEDNDDDDDHCRYHYKRCLMTSLADKPGSVQGAGRCEMCRQGCVQTSGWPRSMPTTKGFVSCNYGKYRRAR